ncbi:MAG: hypothetical protein WCP20_20875 [Desulfuromonadales bacterium]
MPLLFGLISDAVLHTSDAENVGLSSTMAPARATIMQRAAKQGFDPSLVIREKQEAE